MAGYSRQGGGGGAIETTQLSGGRGISAAQVAVCVCTCRRPQMLIQCLRSLAAQVIESNITITIIVVDNEPLPMNEDIVLAFADTCPFEVRYIHEPQRGIAAARNTAMIGAKIEGVSWIAFIDDDEVADPDWIDKLMEPNYRGVPILLGVVNQQVVFPVPFWVVNKKPSKRREGELCKTGTTGNVRIDMRVVYSGYRFDESLGLMGGEDNEFFARTAKGGYEMRRTLRAIVTESAHPDRQTYFGQIYRAYWCAASDVRRMAISKGWAKVYIQKTHTVPVSILIGIIEIAVSPFFRAISLDDFKRRALAGGKKIAKGAGRFAAMIGRLPSPYAIINGH